MSLNKISPALELVERVEPSICDKLANVSYSDFLNFMDITDTRTITDEEGDEMWNKIQYDRIIKYCRYMKSNNYTIKQQYDYAYGSDNGRLFVSNTKTNKAGLQNINRFIRGCLVDGIYTDIDMINAHPNLLRYLCEQNNIICPNLYSFTTNRDNMYDDLMDETGLSRGEVKVLFLKSINSSYPVKQYNKNGKVKANIKTKSFIAFDKEMKEIQKQLMDKHTDLKNKLIKSGKRDNLAGKLLNHLLCKLENEVLQLVRKELNIDMAVIAFDGFMVNNGSYVNTIVDKLDNLTSKYNIKWSIKSNDTRLYNDILSCSDNIKKLYIGKNIIKLADDILAKDLNGKIYNNGEHDKYFLDNDLFITNVKYIKEKLFNWITEQDIYLLDKDNNQVEINNNVKNINDLVSTIISKAPENKQLREQVWGNMLFKLNFNNGYYDFKKQQFITDKQSNTFTKINYDLDMQSDVESREFIYSKVLGPMFGVDNAEDDEQRIQLLEYFLHRLARVMAGHIEDKKWLILNGNRDCGKGVISTILKKCFGDYIRSTNVSNFLYKRTSGDSAKENSWICDYEFKRLAITQEIKNDENECIDGSKIKMFVSGGDDIEARKNFQDEREFKIQSSLMMCVNDKLDINPRDTMEKCDEFLFNSKFVSHDYSGMRLSNIKYYARDDSLKAKILNNQKIINEFVLIIIESYNNVVSYPESIRADNEELDFENLSDDMKIKKLFIQGGEYDFISYHHIKKLLKTNGINISMAKFNNMLKGIYSVKIDASSKKIQGIKLSDEDEGTE